MFVGEAGSELGGMQDYYGSYRDPAAARRSVPDNVHWAEVATVRHGCLEIVAAGQRIDGAWQWDDETTDRLRERDAA